MTMHARSVGFGHALLAVGAALWPRALADAASTSTSTANASATLAASDDCQYWALDVQLEVNVSTPASGPAVRTSVSTVSLRQSNMCNATSRSFSASWNDVAGMRVSDAAQSASVSLARNVILTECSYADGVPNCGERSVPLTLSLGWNAQGQATANTSFRQNNLTGVVQRTFDADKWTMAGLSHDVALDGAALAPTSTNATVSTRVSRHAEVSP